MDPVERLLALEEIKALKARYFRFVDTKDWDGLEGLFTTDAELDFGDDMPGGVLRSAAAFRQMASKSLAGCVSVHHGHCPEIELTSDTTASGVWAMEDMLRWSADSRRHCTASTASATISNATSGRAAAGSSPRSS